MARLGRPRGFDRDAAIVSAMEVFWEKGYDGASLEDLLQAMGGITPPSFYAAFGSKERLFEEALEQYQCSVGSGPQRALAGPNVREALEGMMRAAVKTFSDGGPDGRGARGCLSVCGALTRTRTNAAVHERLRTLRQQPSRLIRARLRQAIAEGELPKGSPVAEIASFYATVLQGLALRAGDGESRRSLMATVDAAMAGWDALTAG